MRLAHANATTATYFAKRVLGLNYYLGQLDNRDDFQPIKASNWRQDFPIQKLSAQRFLTFSERFRGKCTWKERRQLVQSVFTSYNLRQRGF